MRNLNYLTFLRIGMLCLFFSSSLQELRAHDQLLPEVSDTLSPGYAVQKSQFYEKERSLFSEAIRWREKALEAYIAEGDYHQIGVCYYHLADLYYKKGQYHQTLRYVNEALGIFLREKDEAYMLKCYNLLGIIHFHCQGFDQAETYFQKYAEIMDRSSVIDEKDIAQSLNNEAVFQDMRGESLKARSLYKRSLASSISLKDTVMTGNTYLNLAINYLNSRQLDSASYFIERSLSFLSGVHQQARYHSTLSLYYLLDTQLDSAITHMNQAISYYAQGEFDQEEQHCYKILINLYQEVGNDTLAYKALTAYYDIEQQMNRDSVMVELFKMQNDHIIKQQQEQIQIRRNRSVLISVLTAFVLFLLTGLYYIHLKKKNTEVRQKETEIRHQEEINEKNLQVIHTKNELIELKKMQEFQIDKQTEDIISKLLDLSKNVRDLDTRKQIQQICSQLKQTRDEEHWEEMSKYIPEFNSSFMMNLLKEHPDLTVNDKRLCVFLSINLSTKEISEITRQNPASVETARTRLRKRLGLTGNNITLQEYLSRFN